MKLFFMKNSKIKKLLSNPALYCIPCIAVFLTLGFYNTLMTSITIDEPDHCFSGYHYWTTGDFAMQPENPPLGKMLLSIPALFIVQDKTGISYTETESWDAYFMGKRFLYTNPGQGKLILLAARVTVLLLIIPLMLIVFLWSKRLWGISGGILALILMTFAPNLLAHAGIASPDFLAALFILVALITFERFLARPGLFTLFLSSFTLALALATKFSAVLLIFLFLIAFGVLKRKNKFFVVLKPSENSTRKSLHRYDELLSIVIGGLMVFIFLWALYGFEFRTVASVLDPWLNAKGTSVREALAGKRFPFKGLVISLMCETRIPLASFIGGYIKVSAAASAGGPTFLLGHVFPRGFFLYFPVIYFLKTPLLLLILLTWAMVRIIKLKLFHGERFTSLFLIISFIVLYFAASFFVKINIGYRHLLPLVPLTIILCGACAKIIPRQKKIKLGFILLLFIFILGNLTTTGNYLTYFNLAVGGAGKGHKLAGDSNLDWGQTLLQLKMWQHDMKEEKVYGKIFCPESFDFYDIDFEEVNSVEDFERLNSEMNKTWYLVASATYLQGTRAWDERLRERLKSMKPLMVVGNALFIYRLEPPPLSPPSRQPPGENASG
jgi:hypothetical protein